MGLFSRTAVGHNHEKMEHRKIVFLISISCLVIAYFLQQKSSHSILYFLPVIGVGLYEIYRKLELDEIKNDDELEKSDDTRNSWISK